MAESLLPVGMKFTKRFWSTEDIKRRVDYTICVNVSEGNLQYQIKVSFLLEIISKLIFSKVNASNYDWCQNLHDELGKLFTSVNKTRADKNLHTISHRPNGLVSINVIQVKFNFFFLFFEKDFF